MNIIILDLEWNTAYCPKTGGFINEILEFGAVKLDDQLNETDRFQCIVRSSLTKRLRSAVHRLTNITNHEMQNGIPLKDAFDQFTRWAGENLMLTWSDSDIHVLIENSKTLLEKESVPFLYRYADLQKYIMFKMGITGNQISLSAAAEKNNINAEQFLAHRALGDSLCCAEVLRCIGLDDDIHRYIVDATLPDYYARFAFKTHPISDLNSRFVDKNELYATCPVCEKNGVRKTKWKYQNRHFYASFYCNHCKQKFTGRVRFKKTFDGVDVYHFSTPYKTIKKENVKNEKGNH